jgi:hypothetical protein
LRLGKARRLSRQHALDLGIATICAIEVAYSFRWLNTVHPDWILATQASRHLLSSNALFTYRLDPLVQMGPLAIALAQLPRAIYILLIGSILGP